jgi:ribosomal protein L37E
MKTEEINIKQTKYTCEVCGFSCANKYTVRGCENKHRQADCVHTYEYSVYIDTMEGYEVYEAEMGVIKRCSICGLQESKNIDAYSFTEEEAKVLFDKGE